MQPLHWQPHHPNQYQSISLLEALSSLGTISLVQTQTQSVASLIAIGPVPDWYELNLCWRQWAVLI